MFVSPLILSLRPHDRGLVPDAEVGGGIGRHTAVHQRYERELERLVNRMIALAAAGGKPVSHKVRTRCRHGNQQADPGDSARGSSKNKGR
jgi:hypothetical protein